MSIIVQRDATIYSFIIFLHTALHVSDDNLIHHQEYTQNCNYNIWHCSKLIATARSSTSAGDSNKIRAVPDVVIRVLSLLLMMDEVIVRKM